MPETPALARGQWAKAPLVFVIAQVQYSPQADGFSEKLCQLIEQLQPQQYLPSQAQPMMQFSVQFGEGGVPQQQATKAGVAYNLIRKDGLMTVRMAPDSLSLAATTYENSAHFRALWAPMVGCLAKAGLVGHLHRLGMRYVDFVVPAVGATPEQYVKQPWGLQDFPHLPGAKEKPDLHVSVNDLQFDQGRLRLQYMRGYGEPMLPIELQGIIGPARREVRPDIATGIIDSDRWMEGSWDPDQGKIDALFQVMHKNLSDVFRAMITDRAIEEWNPPKEVQST